MLAYLYVGLGGALGSISRLWLTTMIPSHFKGLPLPVLAVNTLGSLIIGLLSSVMMSYWTPSLNLRYFLIPGFLGGFTTFSAYALDLGLLLEHHDYVKAILYVSLSFGLSLLAFALGIKIVRFSLAA